MTDPKTDEHGALFVTVDSEDPRFNQPYIDVREWRDEPADAPAFPGGITTQTGGDAPVKAATSMSTEGSWAPTPSSRSVPPGRGVRKRFFQATHQLLAGEEATPRNVAFALASGGYSVQTNMGGSDNPRGAEESAHGQVDTTIRGYRVNAEAAKFSRVVAVEIYGPHRPYGYLYGGSGGAYQTLTSAEMTTGVWDGFVPYVMGSPQSIPNCFTVRVNALRVLKDKWPSIIDAIEPGGSGDPNAGLTAEEREHWKRPPGPGSLPGRGSTTSLRAGGHSSWSPAMSRCWTRPISMTSGACLAISALIRRHRSAWRGSNTRRTLSTSFPAATCSSSCRASRRVISRGRM